MNEGDSPFEKGRNFEKENAELLRNLWELSGEEIGELRSRIEVSRGLVRMFIHPFYEASEQYPEKSREAELLQRIDEGLKRIATLAEERTPAIFLMEPFRKVEELSRSFSDVALKNRLYVIPTHSASPQPFLNGDKEGLDADDCWSENWNILLDWFKELGVKKVMIGGQYLIIGRTIYHPEQGRASKDELELRGCVGAAGRMFEKDFEVEFSNFAFPKTQKDLKDAGLS
ncbi:MAG: hypothetical protein A3A28_01575 [Candidatus Sungbacteria bacterium RIFCSPLOWO2_01_FULL_47_32]|uniref:Uncharacterized protein n=1 Tax=Candidatus Sungbacteria bacterium RIFCSPHIGHO2_01_FULL_47_32 TaxID=1802264 RepID=A0A1G2K310_9BACT|nr:MAG: hypothetical protein UX72_C0030G0019 [Parcubacteria group bacterium GW2011_GWA2_47_10]OGZ93812.1 MAG: hypothetical protein A2633_05045 [Candidatus Sungbacteria bacterium RIFCSPHIGHO2_01_FULL_47_32]OGZ99666.1 MAG: hypothetical protein A3D57_04260 [Candidatus Sungbacteria bacterium RIFCSPHIGHO2_02_FULL_46_12]OHA05710.1 MAG: hypothetical protein A3A28_01575 [Candidatus Sungbacteria bacterium RIFCSPLOWO2_01_FULL_47_32]